MRIWFVSFFTYYIVYVQHCLILIFLFVCLFVTLFQFDFTPSCTYIYICRKIFKVERQKEGAFHPFSEESSA